MNPPAPNRLTGRIVDWNTAKGFGFVDDGSRRIFVHIRDFAEHHKMPEIGDSIHFTVGTDKQGRSCAKHAVHQNDGGRIRDTHLVGLGFMLIAPGFAVYRLTGLFDARIVLGWTIAIPLLTYWLYSADKQRARDGFWRISESTLHLFEMLGGWPGAFLAQRRLRHKSSKAGFQFVFWLIVASHQFVALDWQLHWQLSHRVGQFLGQILKTIG